jgi:hypothetical protein
MSDNDDSSYEETLTPLVSQTTQLHEIYLAYIEAGFSEARAFELCTIILKDYLDAG